MISPDRSRVISSALLLDEVFGCHTEPNAKRLHGANWRDYLPGDPDTQPLGIESLLLDPQKSQLLLETVDRVLLSATSARNESVIRMRFGLDTGIQATLADTGSMIGVGGERCRNIISASARRLRHPNRSRYLKLFYQDLTTAEISTRQAALPPLNPHQSRLTRH